MSRRTASALDYSIAYDAAERSRAALERNLQNTELSVHLSSHPSDDYSVEFPRHNSGPQPGFSNFRSIEYSYEDGREPHEHSVSQLNAWSYRTHDDEEGITHPTLSTAAHHASALTLSAGLGGRGAANAHRRHHHQQEASLSGAEYDPDRPLTDLIGNVGGKLSMLDDDTRSRYQTSFDPHVARADRAASLRQQQQQTARASPTGSSSSSSAGPSTPPAVSPRAPTLSAHLSHLTFSPKRPRSPALAAAAPRSRTAHHRALSPHPADEGEPTPRARKVHSTPAASRARSQPQPEINVRPPTPSSDNSRFTKMARHLARELEAAQASGNLAQSTVRPHDNGGKGLKDAAPAHKGGKGHAGHSRSVQLPDVTGITAAIETPLRGGVRYYNYKDDGKSAAEKSRLVETLGAVQTRLIQLEDENAGSARRMRELEAELESCRADVAVERARMLRREAAQDEILRRVESANAHAQSRMQKDAERAAREGEQRRYREAVEEKKALETLIGTLRGHMARLGDELSAHQTLLDELRGMREADASTMHEKAHEVDRLRTEVERVAGEVEVLKGFVEEGLRERRARHPDASQVPLPEDEEESASEAEGSGYTEQEDAEEDEPARHPPSPRPFEDSSLYYAPHQTAERTDRATVDTTRALDASPRMPASPGLGAPRPFVDQSEIDRIAEELSERRSAQGSRGGSLAGSGSASSLPTRSRPGSSLAGSSSRNRDSLRRLHSEPAPRPAAPTPAHAAGQAQAPSTSDVSPGAPRISRERKGKGRREPEDAAAFPQIRGERLERLFFSAPAHNAGTCAVCARRKQSRKGASRPLWSNPSTGVASSSRAARREHEDEEDEGFAEGSEAEADAHASGDEAAARTGGAPNLDFLRPGARLPPQTVLVRVLRELEDDFTHYKGIYLELAQQYGLMDPVSNVAKRNVLAEHLREVIDVLEQRGDQIASLYDLLTYEDKPDTKRKDKGRAGGSRKH